MSTAIHYATGRRKTSSARVYLSKGQGKIMVNDKELSHYFGRQVAQMLVMQPLRLTELDEQVDIKAKIDEFRNKVATGKKTLEQKFTQITKIMTQIRQEVEENKKIIHHLMLKIVYLMKKMIKKYYNMVIFQRGGFGLSP